MYLRTGKRWRIFIKNDNNMFDIPERRIKWPFFSFTEEELGETIRYVGGYIWKQGMKGSYHVREDSADIHKVVLDDFLVKYPDFAKKFKAAVSLERKDQSFYYYKFSKVYRFFMNNYMDIHKDPELSDREKLRYTKSWF